MRNYIYPVRVVLDPEPILRTLGTRRKYTMDGSADASQGTVHTRSHLEAINLLACFLEEKQITQQKPTCSQGEHEERENIST